MDLQMPDMNGLEAAILIRSLGPKDTQPQIVAYTASPTTEEKARVWYFGMDDMLGKPLKVEELRAQLRMCRMRHKSHQVAEFPNADDRPKVSPLPTLGARVLGVEKKAQK